jgi:hypothetical protein
MPWFETMKKPMLSFDPQVIRVMSIELVSYGGVLVVACLVRHLIGRSGRCRSRALQ